MKKTLLLTLALLLGLAQPGHADKVSQLPVVTTLTDAVIVPVVASGVTSQASLETIKTFLSYQPLSARLSALAALSAPASNGYVLSSTTGGTLTWIAPAAGSGGVTSVGLTSSTAALTVTGATPIIGSGAWSLSLSVGTTSGTLAAGDHVHAFSTLTSKPTTLGGYGITDSLALGSTSSTAAAGNHVHAFSALTGTPTTLTGYGITDASSTAHTHTFASLTSKPTTLSGYGITDAPVVAPAFVTLTDGATITLTCDATKAVQNFTVTLGGNRTLAISGAANGMTGVLIVKQDATGSRTLALPGGSKVIAGGGGAVTLTTTASGFDVLSWVYDGTNYAWTLGKNFN